MPETIAIIGAGAWGTALALSATRCGHHVTLWSRTPETVDNINHHHCNKVFLPDTPLPDTIKATNNFNTLLQSSPKAILLVCPAQYMRTICTQLQESQNVAETIPLIICSKGIELHSLALMSEVVQEIFPANPLALLSGPNFAKEVASNLPAATTLACEDIEQAEQLATLLSHTTFRNYHTDDIIGAQIAGSVKNVLAIACGIALGKGFGENAKAALITRGLAEMKRLTLAKGGKAETLMGLSGIGDLVLTCSSQQSRNMSLGYALGQGETLEDILNARNTVAEGVSSAASVTLLAERLSMEMPICQGIYDILHQNQPIDGIIERLLNRPLTVE